MTLLSMGARTALVGRDTEQRRLAAAIESAAMGSPSAVLVSGEAGVGKTRLVTEVTAAFEERGVSAYWGRCLRFGTAESSFQPIGHLLTQWFRQAEESERERVLLGLPVSKLATIAPILGQPSEDEPGQLIPLVTTMLERICEARPTVIVIDDLQWADTTSLDLLAYLLAGFGPGQQFAVLATYRDTELREGHRLHGWLADMRRLPLVADQHLEPLGLAETEQLVATLCGEVGAVSRGAEVFAGSRGNPYLIELLSAAPEHDVGGAGGLKDALLASWHRLSGPAREVAQLLAVGGRPVDLPVLEKLAATRHLQRDTVRGCVSELTTAGLATRNATGQVGFRHPLLSEVLVSTLSPGDMQDIHGEYALIWEESTSGPPASRAAHLALHHDGADHDEEAFEWSLRAAAIAADLFAWAEECEHLHRACRLWPRVDPDRRGPGADRVLQLGRASDSAIRAGEYHLALELREDALRLVDRQARPLDAVRLHIHLEALQHYCGISAIPTFEPEMLTLAERVPQSPEHAIAMARLAFTDLWTSLPEAALHAEQAVTLARLSGSDEALAWALGVRSQTRSTPEGLEDAEQAVVHARASGDRFLLAHAAGFRCNVLTVEGRRALAADRTLDVFRELMATGAFYESVSLVHPCCQLLLDVGRWAEARELLREALSRRIMSNVGGELRRVAADLAARTGDLGAARQHLTRARELAPHRQFVGSLMVPAETRVLMAMGDQVQALVLMAEAMPVLRPIDHEAADELLVWAARAAADLAAKPGEHDNAVAWLEQIEQLRGDTPPRFAVITTDDAIHPAWARLFAAEAARCRDGGPSRPELWHDAIAASAAAGLPWEQALSSYRLAQSLLATKGNRAQAASALRDAARIASELGAAPILADVESLARQSHISLTEPATAGPASETPPVFTGLTHREDEVLRQLVAGRTYAEIARDLFISEKTVSVHVSNLLRKTGTSSRIELAELSRRLGPS